MKADYPRSQTSDSVVVVQPLVCTSCLAAIMNLCVGLGIALGPLGHEVYTLLPLQAIQPVFPFEGFVASILKTPVPSQIWKLSIMQ
jgi:hypothetical protein